MLVAAIVFFTPVGALGQDDDPIAGAVDRCLDSPDGRTTSGMEQCSTSAYRAYDDVYRKVMQSADPKSKAMIQASQRAWIAYRDASAPADNGPWQNDRGSMVGPDIAAMKIDEIKARIRQLKYYYGG